MMDKREKIISAAIKIFVEKGIEKTTVSDIVNQAGIGQGTFYLYFSSKLSLVPAIAEVLVREMHESLQTKVTSRDFKEQLTETIDAMFAFTNEYKELTKLMYGGLTQTDHLKDWETIYGPLYKWMEDLLTSAQKADSLRKDLNPKYAARILIGLIETVAEQNYLFADQDSKLVDEYRKELEKFIAYAIVNPS